MKKIKSLLAVSLLSYSVLPAIVLSSCSCSGIDRQIANNDKDGWKHSIEYIADCKHPTIYLTAPTSITIQLMAEMYFSSTYLAQARNHTCTNEQYKYNDNIFVVPWNMYQYKTKKAATDVSFAYNYQHLVGNNGIKDKLVDGFDNANNMVVTHVQDFDNTSEYDKESSTYEYKYSDIKNAQDAKELYSIEQLLDAIYSKYPKGTKFNFVISDWNLDKLLHNKVSLSDKTLGEVGLRLVSKMFYRADKFYSITEGWNSFLMSDLYKEKSLSIEYINYSEKKKVWDALHSDDEQLREYYIKNKDLWFEFINCQEFMMTFASGNEALMTSRFLNKDLYCTKETIIKPVYPWFSVYSFKKLLNDDTWSKYTNAFLDFFHYRSTDTFNNYIINTESLHNYYDQNKKNLIFMMPNYMGGTVVEEMSTGEKLMLDEFKTIINKIKANYPIDKWNYIYKFHPRKSTSAGVESSLKYIFDNTMPTNTVVLEHKYPIEFLLTLDNYLFKTNKQSNYHLIDPRTLNQDKPSGIITSENIRSTSTYTMMEMIANENDNCKWSDVKKLVQYDAFFIPTTYKLTNPDFHKGYYGDINKKEIVDFFSSFYEIDHFIDPNGFAVNNPK